MTIDVTPGVGAAPGTIAQLGAGFAVTLTNLTVTGAGDRLTVTRDGHATSYENASGTAVTLLSTVEAADGRGLEVELTVPAGGTKVTSKVEPETGAIVITSDGTAERAISLKVTKSAVDGTSVVGNLTVTGADKSTVTIDTSTLDATHPLTGQQDTGAGPVLVGDTCGDGAKNGSETDVDCGGTCATRCAVGKACFTATDCGSNVCNVTTNLCVATTCEDGVKSGAESDVDCGGICSAKCALGKGCSETSDCGAGACDPGSKVCASDDRFVFVSSTTTTGNMGGLTGADARCQALAVAAKLPGNYKAFLSAGEQGNAADRIGRGVARYILTDAITVVAETSGEFFSSSHAAPINLTEAKLAPASFAVWTGSQGSGFGDGTGQCSGWSSDTDESMPYEGRADVADERWMSAQFAPPPACSTARRLYCVQEGPQAAP